MGSSVLGLGIRCFWGYRRDSNLAFRNKNEENGFILLLNLTIIDTNSSRKYFSVEEIRIRFLVGGDQSRPLGHISNADWKCDRGRHLLRSCEERGL